MKNLQNLNGSKILSKREQQSINGGGSCPPVSNAVCATCTSMEVCTEIRQGTLGHWCVVGYRCVPRIGHQ